MLTWKPLLAWAPMALHSSLLAMLDSSTDPALPLPHPPALRPDPLTLSSLPPPPFLSPRVFAQPLLSDQVVRGPGRDQMSKEANASLDKTLAAFLRALSPYFLLKATHKVLEYLIRRFR